MHIYTHNHAYCYTHIAIYSNNIIHILSYMYLQGLLLNV